MLQGLDWIIEQDSNPSSVFFDKIDTQAVGSSGHSQGGDGAINAAKDPRVTSSAPVFPAPSRPTGVSGPMFLLGAARDTLVRPSWIQMFVYNPATVPTVFGTLRSANHFAVLGSGGPTRKYLTAWFRWTLMNDASAEGEFKGSNCGLCSDAAWTVQRKGL